MARLPVRSPDATWVSRRVTLCSWAIKVREAWLRVISRNAATQSEVRPISQFAECLARCACCAVLARMPSCSMRFCCTIRCSVCSRCSALAGLFVAGGEALGAGEALLLLALLIVEVVYWLLLCLLELIVALLLWRKPRKVAKPIIWRRKRPEPPEKI